MITIEWKRKQATEFEPIPLLIASERVGFAVAQGMKYSNGLASRSMGSLSGAYSQGASPELQMLIAAGVGGTAEALGGGKFANGAITGAFVGLFNHARHQGNVQSNTAEDGGVVFVDFTTVPKGINKSEFMASLQARLIENGCSENLNVMEYSFWEDIKASLNGTPTATLHIRNFASGDNIDPKTGGFAGLLSNEAWVYPGLSRYDGNNSSVPTWKYVNASIHELGHAIWGFGHDINGYTNFPDGIMDYRGVRIKGANFSPAEQKQILNSGW